MTAWIFQGNPQRFARIDDYFRTVMAGDHVAGWPVTKLHNQKRLGSAQEDEVWFWRSDGGKRGTGGVIAHGRVLSHLFDAGTIRPSILWVEAGQEVGLVGSPYVEVELSTVRLSISEGMILRSSLKANPLTRDLPVLRVPNETNHRLDEHHAAALRQLWGAAPRR